MAGLALRSPCFEASSGQMSYILSLATEFHFILFSYKPGRSPLPFLVLVQIRAGLHSPLLVLWRGAERGTESCFPKAKLINGSRLAEWRVSVCYLLASDPGSHEVGWSSIEDPCLSEPTAPSVWTPAGTERGYHSRFSRLTVSVRRSQMAVFQLVAQLAVQHERCKNVTHLRYIFRPLFIVAPRD